MSEGALRGDLFHQALAAKTARLRHPGKGRIDLDHGRLALVLSLEDVAEEGQAKHRLDAAGAVGNDADRARRGDGRRATVAHRSVILGVPGAAGPIGEAAAL